MPSDSDTLAMLLRLRLPYFARGMFEALAPGEQLQWNWHLDAICHQLERVRSGETTRLIIEVQPRSLKSLLGSVLFPAFVLGHDPTRKIIAASHSLDLARKHANDCRAVMRSARYRVLFPATMVGGTTKDTETDFHTTRRGYRYSTSSSGSLTGRGGDLIILDDIMSATDAASDAVRSSTLDWYSNTLFSRLNDKRSGAIVVITQRLRTDDLVGVLREQPDWVVLSLPSISPADQLVDVGRAKPHLFAEGDLLHPAREPQSALDELRRSLGTYTFSAQYLQQPVPIDGNLVRWHWFLTYDEWPARTCETKIVQSWDIAMSDGDNADWSVCTTWMMVGSSYYLLDVARGRWVFPDLIKQVVALRQKFGADWILIEDKVSGTPLIQQIQANAPKGFPRPIAIRPEGDKVSRFISETPAIEAGQVRLPRHAPWLDELRRELVQFPQGRHDDQVDSISQCLHWARTRPATGVRILQLRGR